MCASSRRGRISLAGGSCLLAVLNNPLALAQGSPAASGELILEEVVVTAQKRSERLQDVAAGVSALAADRIEALKLTSLSDYSAHMPGFNVLGGGTPGQAAITLRGIAPVGPGAVVGVYIDDTPTGSSGNFGQATTFPVDLLPYDLERLEVLRGPQGTLYGAGAMGGLVKYVLRGPDLNEFAADVGADVFGVNHANDMGWSARAAINAPIVAEKFAVRASLYDSRAPGYTNNVVTAEEDINDVRQYGARGSALWAISEDVSIRFNAMWQRIAADDSATVSLGDVVAPSVLDAPYIVEGSLTYGQLGQRNAFAQPFDRAIDHYSATLSWGLGFADLISATSWQRTTMALEADASLVYGNAYPLLTGGAIPPGLAVFNPSLKLEKLTQEIRLVSPSEGKVEWLLGGFFTDEDSLQEQRVLAFDQAAAPVAAFNPYFFFAALPSTYEELAAFGNLTLRFSDEFDVTVGARYARNEQDFRQIGDGVLAVAFGAAGAKAGSSSEGVFTWMTNARYHLTDDAMIYARVGTGYRPGGPNILLPGVPPTVDSDTLTSYEAGVRSEFLERRALLNLAAFYIDWQDIQLEAGGSGANYLANGGTAISKGLELETAYSPVQRVRLGANAAYTEARLTRVRPDNPPVFFAPPFIVGYQLPGVPKWSGAFTADYELLLGEAWSARLAGAFRYVGSQYSSAVTYTGRPGAAASTRFDSYEVVDLSASVSNDRWTVRLFVRNLTDRRARIGSGSVGDGVLVDALFGSVEQINHSMLQPRTVGLSVDVRL